MRRLVEGDAAVVALGGEPVEDVFKADMVTLDRKEADGWK
jgi:hypothetical protein